MGGSYADFLESKRIIVQSSGFKVSESDINPKLFQFQRDIVRWALQKGKTAIFAGTGLGKTAIQLTFGKHVCQYTGGNVLILAPLAVSQQTVREGQKFDIKVNLCRSQKDVKPGINITNYEMLHKFEPEKFVGIILDESSIIKHQDAKMRTAIIEAFKHTPYKLACTATPAPNDHMELGNHAEFLGVMKYTEMLSMFFVHDGGNTSKWRLKGHAKEKFWEWVASWAVMLQKPSDLGYEDGGFILPPLRIHQVTVKVNKPNQGTLFAVEAQTLKERQRARKESIAERVAECAKLINQSDERWIVWCGLNAESEALAKVIDGAVEVRGSHSPEYKEKAMLDFTEGKIKRLVSKPRIAGFGMNWQHCSKMAFVGLDDSFERYFQAIRRCWRFGQTKPVDVYVITAETEGAVVENIKRKEREFNEMLSGMIAATQEITKENIRGTKRETDEYVRDIARGEGWELHLGDCVEVAREIPDDSIHYTIFSPPFASLYTYSNSPLDMGNCRDEEEFLQHFKFLVKELYRITMPGRLLSFHCMNLPTTKQHHGYIGLQDFRGDLIRVFQEAGFIYHSEVVIWKNPVTAVTRTKALGLLHKQLKKDSAMCRQGIPDYLVTMRKPGENPERVTHTDETFPVPLWQRYASPVWATVKGVDEEGFLEFEDPNKNNPDKNGINPSNTLQSAREQADEKHLCCLQLDVIRRAIKLWSNPGDLILDPFNGVGSTGYVAIEERRRYVGIELKKVWWQQSIKNLERAVREINQPTLFDFDFQKEA